MHRSLVLAALGGLLLLAPRAARAQTQADSQGRIAATAALISGPEEGREAPGFSLGWATRDTLGGTGQDYSLRRDLGKVVVLVFYPQDFTPSGTAMLRTLSERHEELFGSDGRVVVLGVSPDSAAQHRKFARALGVPFRLLSDPGLKVARRYGVSTRHGQNRRAVYVLGADGRVRYRDLEFEARGPRSYDKLQQAVRAARG
jgi:thioredoxin-dependent peroxiredoxin